MNLFSRKPKASAPPAEQAPPVIATGVPPAAPAPGAKFKETTILKLDLPDVFAFNTDETRAKVSSGRNRKAEDAEQTDRGTVVLVESDEEVMRLIARLLQHEGLHVAKASCLAEAKTILNDLVADFLLARRHCVPLNLQTEHILRELQSKTSVRIVDDFSELMLGQVIDYESMAQCTLGVADLLMSLLEGANAGARGHAHSVAKYCRLVGQRMGLTRRELDALTLAGLLHDLGSLETRRQIGEPLYTRNDLLPVAVRSTLEMLANTPFPFEISELVNAAADASGTEKDGAPVPKPSLARCANILRVADAYDSLRRSRTSSQMTDEDIFEQLRRQPTGVFDVKVLETFIHMRKNEQAVSAMNIFWAAILIVDPHPEEQQVLKMRLENEDFHVEIAKSIDEALHILHSQSITLVVSEHQLGPRGDGFELLKTMRGDPALRQVPFVFHALAETDLVRYALELGAEDWLAKPHNVEIMTMKLSRIVSRRHAAPEDSTDGVRGNLTEMGIIEMVQILNTGSRSVQISLESGKRDGELTLQRGNIIAATCGELTGEHAALELLSWEEGAFRILPLGEPPPVSIRTSTDNLLLQSCCKKDRENSPEHRGMQA